MANKSLTQHERWILDEAHGIMLKYNISSVKPDVRGVAVVTRGFDKHSITQSADNLSIAIEYTLNRKTKNCD